MNRSDYEAKVKASHEKIYKMYLDGMDKKAIARNTGYSEAYVDLIIRKAKGPTERRSMSDADRDRIVKLRGEGKTIREIACEIGFSMSAVQKYLKERDKEKKSQNEKPNPMIQGNAAHIHIPSGTVIYETVREREGGATRKVKWTFVKQYPHHALFASQYGKKRCFTNAELVNKGICK